MSSGEEGVEKGPVLTVRRIGCYRKYALIPEGGVKVSVLIKSAPDAVDRFIVGRVAEVNLVRSDSYNGSYVCMFLRNRLT